MDKGLEHEKNLLLDTIYMILLKKKLWMRINTVQQRMTMCKKDERPQPCKSRFLLQAKEQVDLPTSEPQEKP